MNLETLVNTHYDNLNASDKKIIKQILSSQNDYQNLSSTEIAKECHISRATLLRLCRKIGLNSFSDLKYLLKEKPPFPTDSINDFHNICTNYHFLIDELKKISFTPVCERIFQAETIYIYGTGNEQKNLAQEFKRIFLSVGKCVIDLFDYGEIDFMKPTFQHSDLFIIISLSGETKEGIEIVKNIQDCLHTLSITRLENNTISSLCEQNLYASTQKLVTPQYSSYELVGVFYSLLDLLFIHYIEYTRRLSCKSKN